MRAPPSGDSSMRIVPPLSCDQLAHDRQADALAADALVEARAAIEHARALVDGNARTVVLDDEAQPVAARGRDRRCARAVMPHAGRGST